MSQMMLIASASCSSRSSFFQLRSACAIPETPQARLSGRRGKEHTYKTRTQSVAPQQSVRPQAVVLLESGNSHIECSFVSGFLELAADIHYIVRAYTPRRNVHTLHPIAHAFGLGCVDVSTTSEGHEPQKVRNKGSAIWSGSACWKQPRAGIYSKFIWEFSHVRRLTTDVVSFHTSDKSILSYGENAGSGTPDAHSCTFGAGGNGRVRLNIEVNDPNRTNRRELAEWPRMRNLLWNRMIVVPWFIEINSSNLLSENVNDVPEMQSVKQYCTIQLNSKRHRVLEVRQAQMDNESTMQQRDRAVLIRLGDEAQDALRRQQRAHMEHGQHQLVSEGEAHIYFVRQHLE